MYLLALVTLLLALKDLVHLVSEGRLTNAPKAIGSDYSSVTDMSRMTNDRTNSDRLGKFESIQYI